MSIECTHWVLKQSRARHSARLVLFAIADRANPEGSDCYPSVAYLSRATLLSERAVQEAIGTLEALGELVIERRGGRTNRFVMPLRASAAPTIEAQDAVAPPQNLHPSNSESDPRKVCTPPRKVCTPPRRLCTPTPADSAPHPAKSAPDPSLIHQIDPSPNRETHAPEGPPFDRPRRKPQLGLVRGPDPTCYRDAPGSLGVPHQVHRKFLELRVARGMAEPDAVRELDAFYDGWIARYTEGDRARDNPEADRFKFWQRRHDETWPPTAPSRAGVTQPTPTGPAVPGVDQTRRLIEELQA